MPTPTCSICGQPARYHSWVQGRPTCTGRCYATAVARVLAARRLIRATPAPTRPFDRSPMPMTEENAAALERDMRGRSWAMRTRRPPTRGRRHCEHCGMELRRERDALHVPFLGVFCTLTCATVANGGVLPEL